MGEVGCHNCIGACCTRLMELPLTNDEAVVLQTAGTALTMLIDPNHDLHTTMPAETPYDKQLLLIARQLTPGTGLFQLLTDCAFLEPVQDGMAKCSIFGQEKRPTVCSTFQESSSTCRRVRLTRGIWDY